MIIDQIVLLEAKGWLLLTFQVYKYQAWVLIIKEQIRAWLKTSLCHPWRVVSTTTCSYKPRQINIRPYFDPLGANSHLVNSLQLILANESLIGYILVSLVLFGSTSKKVGCIGGLFIMSFLFYLLLVEQIHLYRWEDKSFFFVQPIRFY